jgi:hypothetical protein
MMIHCSSLCALWADPQGHGPCGPGPRFAPGPFCIQIYMERRKVSLVQPIRFLVVKLIHSDLNFRFDMCVVFTANYSFSWRQCSCGSETLLMTNFVNLKTKPAQFFGCVHRGSMYVRVFIGVSAHTCMSIYVYTVFLKIYIHGTSRTVIH